VGVSQVRYNIILNR